MLISPSQMPTTCLTTNTTTLRQPRTKVGLDLYARIWLPLVTTLPGKQDGAVWAYSGSFDNYMANLCAGRVVCGGYDNATAGLPNSTYHSLSALKHKRDASFWLTTLGPLGKVC